VTLFCLRYVIFSGLLWLSLTKVHIRFSALCSQLCYIYQNYVVFENRLVNKVTVESILQISSILLGRGGLCSQEHNECTDSSTVHWYIENLVDGRWRNVGLLVVRNHIETLVDVATLSSVLYQCLVMKVVGEGDSPIHKLSCQASHVILMECVWEGGRPDKYWPPRNLYTFNGSMREGVWFNRGSFRVYCESGHAPYYTGVWGTIKKRILEKCVSNMKWTDIKGDDTMFKTI
jgi:hypothetical protein